MKWAMVTPIAPETSNSALEQFLYWGDQTAILDRLRLDLAALRQKLKQDQNMDLMAKIGALHQHMEKALAWTAPVFPLGGKDLIALGVEPGEEMGKILKALEQHWVDEGFQPSKDTLLAKAKAEHLA